MIVIPRCLGGLGPGAIETSGWRWGPPHCHRVSGLLTHRIGTVYIGNAYIGIGVSGDVVVCSTSFTSLRKKYELGGTKVAQDVAEGRT